MKGDLFRLAAFVLVAVIQFHLAESCQSLMHDQCIVPDTLCFRRKCIQAEAFNTSIACRNMLQCVRQVLPHWRRRAVGCKGGRCMILRSPLENMRCLHHDQCTMSAPGSFRAMCVRQTCVWAVPVNYRCGRNGFCRLGERCIDGRCYEPFDGTNN